MAGELDETALTPTSLLVQITGWKPGDVVLDDSGEIWTRADEDSVRQGWPWHLGAMTTREPSGDPYAPEGDHSEDKPVRPLTLLVRAGRAVRRNG
jgi:hypothetical protein